MRERKKEKEEMRYKVFGRNEENRMPKKVSMEDSSKWNTMKDRLAAVSANKKIKSSTTSSGGGGDNYHHSASSSPTSVLQHHHHHHHNQNHQRCRRNENAWTIDRDVNLRRNESGELGCYVENGRVIYTWGRKPV